MTLIKTGIVAIAIILTIVILMVVLWPKQKNKKTEKEEKNTDVLDSENVEKFSSYPERQGYNDFGDGSIQMDESRPASMAIIYKSEMDYISRCIHDYPNIETGGQLFGFVTEYGAPVVCYAIGPGPRANHQSTQFNQDTEYLQNTYNELNRRYGLRYIGEWHSHHQLGLAKPSGGDISTVVYGIQKNKFRHFLLCIGNCDNNFHSTLNAFTFHLDDPYNYNHAPWMIIEMDSPYRAIVDREMKDVLCHPRTRQASHGSNYLTNGDGVSSRVTPTYSDEYWLNNKANNLILKNIIDYLTTGENEGNVVKPQLDSHKHVHLMVQKNNSQIEIVFDEKFPNEAPKIYGSDEVRMNNSAQWIYEGDIYDSFVRYYKDCLGDGFTSQTDPTSVLHEYTEPQTSNIGDSCNENEKSDTPNEDHIDIRNEEVTEVYINQEVLDAFDGSSLVVYGALSSIGGAFNLGTNEYGPSKKVLKTSVTPFAETPMINVTLYKDKASDYQSGTFILEDTQSEQVKAFYINAEGQKNELKVTICHELL